MSVKLGACLVLVFSFAFSKQVLCLFLKMVFLRLEEKEEEKKNQHNRIHPNMKYPIHSQHIKLIQPEPIQPITQQIHIPPSTTKIHHNPCRLIVAVNPHSGNRKSTQQLKQINNPH
jgi:hypothetical protein